MSASWSQVTRIASVGSGEAEFTGSGYDMETGAYEMVKDNGVGVHQEKRNFLLNSFQQLFILL